MNESRIHSLVSGRDDAPTVVLSGSLGATTAMWEPQLAALEEHFRVVRYDTRGHGLSPAASGPLTIDDLADDLLAVLDRHGAERAHLVGLSLGGATALRVAIRAPERVERLAVMCTSAQFAPAQAWHDRAALARSEGLAGIAQSSMERWFTPAYLASTDVSPHVAMIAGNDPEGYAACCEALAAMDLRDQLGEVRAPTLVIAGADDPATPPAALRAIAEGVPHAAYVEVPGASHLASIEQPAAVNAALIPFLTGTDKELP